MNIDKFQSEITKLDQRSEEHIGLGGKPSEHESEYRQCIEALICQASNGESWSDVVKHIAYLIYAGGLMEIALKQTRLAANDAAETATTVSRKLAIEQCKANHIQTQNTELKRMSEYFQSALIDAPKRAAKKAVSNRKDQILKAQFMDFCKLVASENNLPSIKTIRELLAHENCDPSFKREIEERTLKAWAKHCGFTFKAGRPSKK